MELPNSLWFAGIWPGAHFRLFANIEGKEEGRIYTPVSPVNQKGSVDFIMKIYRNNLRFPNGGKFS